MVTQTNDEIIIVLTKLISLLEKTEDYDWACFFTNIKNKALEVSNTKQIAREILQLYCGGMGGVVDLILHKDMKMLIEENNELAEYKEQLFQLCKKILGQNELTIKLIIENLIMLLRQHDEINWRITLSEVLNKYVNADTRDIAVQEILSFYKTDKHSFTEFSFHKNSKKLTKENHQLVMLRDALYKDCIEYCKSNSIVFL